MGAIPLEGRSCYKCSGKVNWVRFIPWAALAWVTSAAAALVLFVLFQWGVYLVLLVPLLVGLGVGMMVLLAVRQGHCRSRLVAGLLGAVAGVTVYLGYFYISMVAALGLEYAGRLDLLPRYIAFRMQTNVIQDVDAPKDQKKESNAGDTFFNWLFFAGEFGGVMFLAVAPGVRRAGRPYCEKCMTWMDRETTRFKPEIGPAFVEALRQDAVRSLAALFTSPQKNSPPNTAVALDYCPSLKSGKSADCAVYLSVKQVVKNPPGAVRDQFEGAKGKMLLSRIQVNAGELAALLPRFSVLEKATGTTAAEALAEKATAVADIRAVDPAYAGKVLTRKTKIIGTALTLLGLLCVFGPVALGPLGAWLAFPDHPPEDGVPPTMKFLGEFLIGTSIVIFVVNVAIFLTVPDYLATRYLRRRITREFARRPDHLITADDPGAQFVQVIPRENWGKLKLDDASDVGFLRLDAELSEVLFEGDNEYYRIPAAAITSCEVERFVQGEGTHGATAFYRLVLEVNTPSGVIEKPIGPRGGNGKFRAKKRERWARDMEQRIRAMMSSPAA